jgi:hypothetical protein
MNRKIRREKLSLSKVQRRKILQLVKEEVERGLPVDDACESLRQRMILKFDPASILFSIALSWAIKQLIKWLRNELVDKELGDIDDAT